MSKAGAPAVATVTARLVPARGEHAPVVAG